MARVVAIESDPAAAPVEAILIDYGKPNLLRWWGGYAWETLMITSVGRLLENDSTYRALELELPENWEDGYLEPTEDGVRFVLGTQPKRADWEAKRWSKRLMARLRARRS